MSQLPAKVGASDTLFSHERPTSIRRSKFDLSRITNFTCDAGMIVPFDWIFCLPGDDVDISFEMILDTLPLVNASLTSYKVLTHWYKIDCKDLWEGWQTFITRGRSGNVNLTLPKVNLNHTLNNRTKNSDGTFTEHVDLDFGTDDSGNPITYSCRNFYPWGHHSLASYLGIPSPQSGWYKRVINGEYLLSSDYYPNMPAISQLTPAMPASEQEKIRSARTTGFNLYAKPNALLFMAYQNIVKYNYVNQNLLQNNHSLFPIKGDHDWFLKYDASETNYVDYSSNSEVTGEEVYSYTGVFSDSDTVTRLDQLRYAMFDDDYFTTGLPWLSRGTVDESLEKLPVDFSDIGEVVKQFDDIVSSDVWYTGNSSSSFTITGFNNGRQDDSDPFLSTGASYSPAVPGNPDTNSKITSSIRAFLNKLHLTLPNGSAAARLTVDRMRELLAVQVWQERNARVNGSYNSMIYQHWHNNPHAEEHKPQYIGGTADYVSFATVLQNSQSTDDSPLGSTAGRGSTGGRGYVGKVHCDDYCYIMGVMIIKPNTTYMQGVEHHLSCEDVFDDFPQPEFEGLSPQPILNKELFVSGDDNDNNLLCYQERYVYLKVRQNVNRGLFQVKPDKDRLFGSFTQARWFENRPTFSYQFLCMSPDNIRRDFLAYPAYPMFKLQTASKIFVTRSLAYTSEPNTFGF